MSLIVVLEDGETYTGLEGCKIVLVPERGRENANEDLSKLDIASFPYWDLHSLFDAYLNEEQVQRDVRKATAKAKRDQKATAKRSKSD